MSVSGDSAFGFSGMELETICRYDLPITTIVLNNGGIGGGFEDWPADQPLPPSALSRTARYEKVCEAFGGQGYYVEDPADLRPTLDKAISSGKPSVVHVLIAAQRRPQAAGVPLEDVSVSLGDDSGGQLANRATSPGWEAGAGRCRASRVGVTSGFCLVTKACRAAVKPWRSSKMSRLISASSSAR